MPVVTRPIISRRRFLQYASAAAAAFPQSGGAALPVPAGRRIMSDDSAVLRSTFTQAGERMIHALVSVLPAPRQAPPVVLVHGLALSGQYMVPTADELAPHYHVLVPDFPGFGDSEKPSRALDVPLLADALAGWMETVGCPRAALLGNSFGCQIIVDFAARYPHLVACAVLQGPTTPPDERSWLMQFIRWQQNSQYNPPKMGKVAGIDYAKCGITRALATFEFSLRDEPEEKLAAIQAPTLVVRGAKDPICRQYWAERVAAALPNGRLEIIPDVAHTLVFTSPEALVSVSRPFIDAVTR
ncbi:Lipase 3 [Nitratireductor thuwali]|uniref:Lipase 3 n=1 Tax=Nitratireductor thuwali TaxID=2267699 RepID=A0ABY5MH10_9HYPH|nr:Lipase 3 [Nitratireductor thuwali]